MKTTESPASVNPDTREILPIERERKFLVRAEYFKPRGVGRIINVGYFAIEPVAVRVALNDAGRAKAAFKGPGTEARLEVEYVVKPHEAEALIALAPWRITKTRFEFDGWEVDVFGGKHMLAEWEEGEGKVFPAELPPWLGPEVTHLRQFQNQFLARDGWPTW